MNVDAQKKKNGTSIPANLSGQARECYQAAVNGDDKAQLMLGYCYQEGEGAPKDQAMAIYWYQQAAEKGNVIAQYYWFRKAAAQGNALGQRCLGICYDEGNGVSQDHKIAAEWYEKAAIQGDPVAQLNLGLSYAEGQGVKKDKKKAIEWLSKAAAQGEEDAKQALKELGK